MVNMKPYLGVRVLGFLSMLLYFGTFAQGKEIFCYYSSFAVQRPGAGKFQPEDINPDLCTHLIFAFVDITPDGRDLTHFSSDDVGPNGLYQRTQALRKNNRSLKILLAVGGWRIGSKPFTPMIKDESNRQAWIQNVISYLRKHEFDGFDVDWEFPATRGSPPEDKYRFTLLMKGLFEGFAREAVETGKEKLLLTLATASGTYYIDQSYEPHKIIKYMDYMLLMTYNYHGHWESITGHHSGLNRHRNDPTSGEKSQLYQQWSIDYWLNMGLPKDKLVVGIPTYGMSFTLADQSNNGVHAPVTGGGKVGEFTRETGVLSYYEICVNLRAEGWQSRWIEDQDVPYAYSGDQWVGYEDPKSTELKAKNILSRGLAGAFVWSVEMDDFRGVCGQGKYPLMSVIRKYMQGDDLSVGSARHSEIKQDLALNMTFSIQTPSNENVKHIDSKNIPELNKRPNAASAESQAPTETSQPTPEVASAGQEDLSVKQWKSSGSAETGVPRESSARPHKVFSRKLKKAWRRVGNQKVVSQIRSLNEEQPKLWFKVSDSVKKGLDLDSVHYADTEKKIEALATVAVPPSEKITPVNAAAAGSTQGSICRKLGVGTFADLNSCAHFIICMPGDWQEYAPLVMACPPGTRFDPKLKICNYASRVECKI